MLVALAVGCSSAVSVGGGTGFGTLARFYYPDFSVRHDPSEFRIRAVDVLTVQPTEWLASQVGLADPSRKVVRHQGESKWS